MRKVSTQEIIGVLQPQAGGTAMWEELRRHVNARIGMPGVSYTELQPSLDRMPTASYTLSCWGKEFRDTIGLDEVQQWLDSPAHSFAERYVKYMLRIARMQAREELGQAMGALGDWLAQDRCPR